MSAAAFDLHLPRLSPKLMQWALWQPDAPRDMVRSSVMSATIGTGKSTAAFCRFMLACMRGARWNPSYGRSNPLAVVMSPTEANLTENLVPLFFRHIPADLILEYRVSPSRYMILAWGTKILFKSGLSMTDSFSSRVMLLDECHNRRFYGDDDKFKVTTGRCRDKRAAGMRELIFSGIAEPDEITVRRFRKECDNVVTPGLDDNPGIDEDYRSLVLGGLTEREAKIARVGGWRETLEGNAFGDVLDLRIGGNLTADHKEDGAPVIVSIDPGNQCAVLFLREIQVHEMRDGQPTGKKVPGLVAIDEMFLDDADSRQAVQAALETPYNVREICIDTASTGDTRALIRDAWSGAMSQLPKGSASWRRKEKLNRLRWSLRDAHGTRRLLIHEDLMQTRDRRGLVNGLKFAELRPNGDDLVKNNATDHVREACAQAVVAKLRRQKAKIDYSKQGAS